MRESSLSTSGLHRTNQPAPILLSRNCFQPSFSVNPPPSLSLSFRLYCRCISVSRPQLSCSRLFRKILEASRERYQSRGNLSVLAVVSTFYFHPIERRGPLRITPLESSGRVLFKPNRFWFFGDSTRPDPARPDSAPKCVDLARFKSA